MSRKNILENISANSIAKAMILFHQAFVTPLLIMNLGLEKYGNFVFYLVLPSYLVLLDFGFGVTLANRLPIAWERRNILELARLVKLTKYFHYFLNLFVFLVIISICFLFSDRWFENERIYLLLILILLAFHLKGGAVSAVYRMKNKYAVTVWVANLVRAFELLSIIIIFSRLKTEVTILLILVLGKVLEYILLTIFSSGLKKDLLLVTRVVRIEINIDYLRQIVLSSTAYVLLPVSQTMRANGAVFLLGFFYGGTLTATFNVIKTLFNVVGQLLSVLLSSYWPEMTVRFSKGDLAEFKRTAQHLILIMGLVSIGSAIVISILHAHIFSLWLNADLSYEANLIYLLAASAILSSFWQSWSLPLVCTDNAINLSRGIVKVTLLWLALASLLVSVSSEAHVLQRLAALAVVCELLNIIVVKKEISRFWIENKYRCI